MPMVLTKSTPRSYFGFRTLTISRGTTLAIP
jgi:hypothetical protein